MGQKHAGGSGQTPGQPTNDTDNKNRSTGTTTTESGRTGRQTEGTKHTEKIPRLVSVEVPGEEPTSEPPKKGRGRPKGSTKKQTKKAVGKKPDTTNLKMLMLTVSGIVASRPGMDMWALSVQEIDQLAEPLAAIMARHNVTESTGEYADYIALVMACFIIFAPKYMMYKQTKPKKEKVTQSNAKPVDNSKRTGNTAGTNTETKATGGTRGEVKRAPAGNGPSLSGNLYNLLPAIDG